MDPREDTFRIWLVKPLSIGITIAWFVALGAGVYKHDYEALKFVSVPFGIMIGYAFGVTTINLGKK